MIRIIKSIMTPMMIKDNDRLCTLFTALLWRPSTAMSHLCSQNLPLCFLALNLLYLFALIRTYLHLFAQVCIVVGTSSFLVISDVPAKLPQRMQSFIHKYMFLLVCICVYMFREIQMCSFLQICVCSESLNQRNTNVLVFCEYH